MYHFGDGNIRGEFKGQTNYGIVDLYHITDESRLHKLHTVVVSTEYLVNFITKISVENSKPEKL